MSERIAEKSKHPKAAKPAESAPSLIALKAFTIVQNEYQRVISPGDDLKDVPERFLVNLKTEGVLN